MRCPSCGKLAIARRNDPWVCNHCHAALPPREKLKCNWSGMLCDIPCMYNTLPNETGERHPCRWPRKRME